MMSSGKILITPRSLSKDGHPYLQRLREAGYEVIMPYPGKQPTEEELIVSLPGCVGYLAGVEKVTARVLDACPSLRVISRNGVGIDNVDPEAAARQHIVLKVARGANSRGVAELAISAIFTLYRAIIPTHNSVKNGGWERTKGHEVCGKTLGLIGTGQIGQYVAKMARGLDMQIIAYDLYPNPELEVAGLLQYRTLEEVLQQSDILSLHCPAGEEPLLNRDSLQQVKDGVVIINTAREALVAQEAMLDALNSRKVAGYAVDAFACEPPELTPLLQHERVILSSHIGGFTSESVDRATIAAVDNILEVL